MYFFMISDLLILKGSFADAQDDNASNDNALMINASKTNKSNTPDR